jgi:hypothetical protein
MFRFNLRTLLIVLALGPPVLAGAWWILDEWRRIQVTREASLLASDAQQRLARLEEEMSGQRGTVAGVSPAEIDRRFAEIVAAVEAAQHDSRNP